MLHHWRHGKSVLSTRLLLRREDRERVRIGRQISNQKSEMQNVSTEVLRCCVSVALGKRVGIAANRGHRQRHVECGGRVQPVGRDGDAALAGVRCAGNAPQPKRCRAARGGLATALHRVTSPTENLGSIAPPRRTRVHNSPVLIQRTRPLDTIMSMLSSSDRAMPSSETRTTP